MEYHFLRLDPRDEFFARNILALPLIEVAGKTVFEKNRRFPHTEKFRVQPTFCDFCGNIYCRAFEVEFVFPVHHYVVVRKVLLADIVQLVDTVDALPQDTLFDFLDIGIILAFGDS